MGERADSPLDRELARLADGDRSAFPSIFATLWPVVQRFCRRALANEADADDAAQVALQKLFGQASSYDRQTPAVAWALTIAAWECRTIRRRGQRARVVALDDASGAPSSGPSPEELVVQRDLEAAVHAAFEQLAGADQEALRRALDEVRGVGSALDRKRKQRALHRLRDVFRRIYGT